MSEPSDLDANLNPQSADSSLDSIASKETSPQPSQQLLPRLWHRTLESAKGSLKPFNNALLKQLAGSRLTKLNSASS